MLVKILKSFPYSRNGVDTLQAVEGTEADIPDPYIDGLLRERFVAHVEAAPVNKMMDPIMEVGQTIKIEASAPYTEIDLLREQYTLATGREADKRWGEKRLAKEVAKAGIPKSRNG